MLKLRYINPHALLYSEYYKSASVNPNFCASAISETNWKKNVIWNWGLPSSNNLNLHGNSLTHCKAIQSYERIEEKRRQVAIACFHFPLDCVIRRSHSHDGRDGIRDIWRMRTHTQNLYPWEDGVINMNSLNFANGSGEKRLHQNDNFNIEYFMRIKLFLI